MPVRVLLEAAVVGGCGWGARATEARRERAPFTPFTHCEDRPPNYWYVYSLRSKTG